MKSKCNLILSRVIPAALACIVLAGCAHDDFEYIDFNGASYSDEETKTGFHVTREYDSDVNGYIEEYGSDTKATSTNMLSALTGVLSSVSSSSIHHVAGTFKSVDVNGDTLTVSGKLYYPKKGNVRRLMIVSHFTIGSNAECPSEGMAFEAIYAFLGYAVAIADYVGFGCTRNMIHPYLQAETTSRNVADMGICAWKLLKARGLAPEEEEIYLLGYSQGGAGIMHTLNLLENDERYKGIFKIKKTFAGAGPYDIAKTYDYSIKKDETGIPSAVPMIIQGMSIGMAKPLEMEYFFREPLKSHYNDWLNSKNYTVGQINILIGSNSLKEILTSNGTDKTKAQTARFYQELVENRVPKYFIPKTPVYMFHSENDETVPFINSQLMENQFRFDEVEVEYDFDMYGTHQQGAIKFILKVFDMIK